MASTTLTQSRRPKRVSAQAKALVEAQASGDRFAEAAAITKMAKLIRSPTYTRGRSLDKRLMDTVVFGLSDCWYFSGYIDQLGYGRVRLASESKAHRASYRIFKGQIPQGMVVMHTCDVRNCVNPDHLLLGTQQENIKDMDAKGRRRTGHQMGAKNPMSKLTDAIVIDIRRRAARGESHHSLARELGVSPMTVNRAVRKESWKCTVNN